MIQLLGDRVEVGVEAIGIRGNLLGERPQCFCDLLLVQPPTVEVIRGAGIGEAPGVLFTVEQLEVEFVDKRQHVGMVAIDEGRAQLGDKPVADGAFHRENATSQTTPGFEHGRLDASLLQLVGGRESGQAGADHHHPW